MTNIPDKKTIKFNGRCTEAQDKMITEMMADLDMGRSEVLLYCLEQVAAKNADVTSDLRRMAALAEPFEEMVMNGKVLGEMVGDMQKIAKMGEKLDALVGKLEGFEAAASGQKEGLEKLLKTMPAELAKISDAISVAAKSADASRAGYAKDAAARLDEISKSLAALKQVVLGDPARGASGIVDKINEILDHARIAAAHSYNWHEHVGKLDRHMTIEAAVDAARGRVKRVA